MLNTQYLAESDFEVICIELEYFFKKIKDPSPNYKHTYFDKLDSVINIPKRTFDGKDLYEDVYKKASSYFYFINKLHPFNNGNKRISIVATGVFLLKNSIELTADQEPMYEFAKEVTVSNNNQDHDFLKVVSFIKKNSRKILNFINLPQIIFSKFLPK